MKDKPSLEWEFGLALRGAGPTGVIKIEIRRVLIGGLEVVCGKKAFKGTRRFVSFKGTGYFSGLRVS